MKYSIKGYKFFFGVFFLSIGTASVGAPKHVNNSPIQIQADSANIDNLHNISIYKGHVKVIQDNMELLGEVITVYTDSVSKKITKIVADGNAHTPAFCNLKNQGKKGVGDDVKGWAGNIRYDVSSGIMYMKSKAKVIRNGESLTGDFISYDKSTRLMSARRNNRNSDQVKIILQPGAIDTLKK